MLLRLVLALSLSTFLLEWYCY